MTCSHEFSVIAQDYWEYINNKVHRYVRYSAASCLQCPHSTDAPRASCTCLRAERICFELDPAAITHLLKPARAIPEGNGARITGDLPRGNELLNVFPERTRMLETLQENSL